MSRLGSRRLLPVIVLAAAALVWLARKTEPYRVVEYRTLDWRFRSFSDPSRADQDIALVMLDQPTLDHFEIESQIYWPWPRSVYNALLAFAKAGGARVVAFDILFTSPSPYGQDQDAEFGRALKENGRAILAAEFGHSADPRRNAAPPGRFAAEVEGDLARVSVEKLSGKLPVPELLEGPALLGDVNVDPDSDGVFRRVPLLSRFQGRAYPTMAAAAWLLASGEKLRAEGGRLQAGGREIPLQDGRLLLKFHGSALAPRFSKGHRRTYPSYSVGEIVLSQLALEEGRKPSREPAIFKDKIVLVGYSAPGLLDNRPSPISPVFPGTEILAVAIDNLLNSDFLVPAGERTLAFAILAAALLGAAAALVQFRLGASLGLLAAGASLTLAAGVVAFKRGVWLELAAPEGAMFLSFAAVSAYSYVVEGRSKRFIKQAFALYLSPVVVDRIVKRPDRLKLEGERREVTLFFSDIEGFTTISETLPPERLAAVMNRYLTEMSDIILETGGTLDKYIGDAIMAFWGAPLDAPDHALRACRAAILNQKKMAELREGEFDRQGLPPLRMRIGLNSGACSIGNLGSTRRFSYTALGDEVNLASRLEGVNKQYGTFILLSEATRRRAGDAIEVRELDFIKVKGKNKPIRVFELLGFKGEVEPTALERARRFEEGLAAYRARKWDEAIGILSGLNGAAGDASAALFIDRCRHFAHEPPAADWDGSYALKEK